MHKERAPGTLQFSVTEQEKKKNEESVGIVTINNLSCESCCGWGVTWQIFQNLGKMLDVPWRAQALQQAPFVLFSEMSKSLEQAEEIQN